MAVIFVDRMYKVQGINTFVNIFDRSEDLVRSAINAVYMTKRMKRKVLTTCYLSNI
jgi:hypothetical protein